MILWYAALICFRIHWLDLIFGFRECCSNMISTHMFYQLHQVPLLCDHQELACTLEDPPRRVDVNEMSLISFHKNNYCVIDKTVWTPTLESCGTFWKPHMCFYISIDLLLYLNIFALISQQKPIEHFQSLDRLKEN